MLKWFTDLFRQGEWHLEGWDTFAGHSYPLPGHFYSKDQAIRGARRVLAGIRRDQPDDSSGGQDGIQDRVYVIGPEGERLRVLP